MKHRHETEIKLHVRDPKALKRRLRNLGFEVARPRYFESNYLFDFPDLRLRKARCLVRLRFAGRQGLLTFKGTPLRSQSYKIRREIETVIDDGHGLREILEYIGLQETFYYEKYRTVYAPRGKGKVTEAPLLVYDETPIGNYVELEGPERWIDEVASQLGYEREDYIPSSYGALYRQKCLARGAEPGNMIFPAHRLHRKS